MFMTNKVYIFPVFLIIILAILVGGCQKEENSFTLEVDIQDFTDTTAVLYGVFSQPDSLMSFPIKGGKLKCVIPMDTITPMYLVLGDGGQNRVEMVLFAEENTNIRIEGNVAHLSNLKITGGGEEQKLYQTFLDQRTKENITKEIQEIADSFITAHPLSVVSVFLVKEYFAQASGVVKEQVERAVGKLSGKMQDHPYILRLQDELKDLKETQLNKSFYFTAFPDTIGRSISQKEFKDCYVVLSFWASWHEESREMLDSLESIIELFKKKPVRFVHLSLDNNRENWVNAIRSDSISGIHVCTSLGWTDPTVVATGITDIPCNIVISPQNRIIGKNMENGVLIRFIENQLNQSKRKKDK